MPGDCTVPGTQEVLRVRVNPDRRGVGGKSISVSLILPRCTAEQILAVQTSLKSGESTVCFFPVRKSEGFVQFVRIPHCLHSGFIIVPTCQRLRGIASVTGGGAVCFLFCFEIRTLKDWLIDIYYSLCTDDCPFLGW